MSKPEITKAFSFSTIYDPEKLKVLSASTVFNHLEDPEFIKHSENLIALLDSESPEVRWKVAGTAWPENGEHVELTEKNQGVFLQTYRNGTKPVVQAALKNSDSVVRAIAQENKFGL